MATTSMDAVELLKTDHRKAEKWFGKYEKSEELEQRRQLALEICTELTIHTMIEEEIFYPACMGQVGEETMDDAYVEHDGAKVLISEIGAGSPSDKFYDAKVRVLSEMIKHHVKEEEKLRTGMFAQAKRADVDLESLGRRMTERKQELQAQIEAHGLPTPETRSYSGHELEQGSPLRRSGASA